MIQLRPHHLLCIQNYCGHGYDEAFTKHMDLVTDSLRKRPDQTVRLIDGCDDLCLACPNRKEDPRNIGHDICDSQEKVLRMDREVILACGFNPGEEAAWEVLAKSAKDKILLTAAFENICAECCWYDLCASPSGSRSVPAAEKK